MTIQALIILYMDHVFSLMELNHLRTPHTNIISSTLIFPSWNGGEVKNSYGNISTTIRQYKNEYAKVFLHEN